MSLNCFSEIPDYDIYYIVLIERRSIFLSVQVIHHGENQSLDIDHLYLKKKCSSFFVRLLLRPAQSLSSSTTIAIVWIMAFLGITYQILYHERYKLLETCIYIVVGLFPALVIVDMVQDDYTSEWNSFFYLDLFEVNHDGLWAMALGGLMFLSGVVFFKSDGLIPFAHAIWHCFVFLGAAFHYYAVYNYLIVPSPSQTDPLRQKWVLASQWTTSLFSFYLIWRFLCAISLQYRHLYRQIRMFLFIL